MDNEKEFSISQGEVDFLTLTIYFMVSFKVCRDECNPLLTPLRSICQPDMSPCPPLESPYCTATSKNPELICDLPTFNQPLSNFHTGKDIGHIGEPPHIGTLIFCVQMIVAYLIIVIFCTPTCFLGLKKVRQKKVRKFATKFASRQNSVNQYWLALSFDQNGVLGVLVGVFF